MRSELRHVRAPSPAAKNRSSSTELLNLVPPFFIRNFLMLLIHCLLGTRKLALDDLALLLTRSYWRLRFLS